MLDTTTSLPADVHAAGGLLFVSFVLSLFGETPLRRGKGRVPRISGFVPWADEPPGGYWGAALAAESLSPNPERGQRKVDSCSGNRAYHLFRGAFEFLPGDWRHSARDRGEGCLSLSVAEHKERRVTSLWHSPLCQPPGLGNSSAPLAVLGTFDAAKVPPAAAPYPKSMGHAISPGLAALSMRRHSTPLCTSFAPRLPNCGMLLPTS